MIESKLWENMSKEEKEVAKKIMQMSEENSMQENANVSSLSFGMKLTKAEKFGKLSERRLQKTLNELDKIANLSKVSRYEYTEEQAEEIVKELEERLATIKVLFERNLELHKKKSKKSVSSPHTSPTDEV